MAQTTDKGNIPIMGEDELNEFIMRFYENPEPGKLTSALLSLSHYGGLDKSVIELSNVVSFFATVIRLYPDYLEPCIELALQLPDNHRFVFWESLWLTNLPQAYAFLRTRMRISDKQEHDVIKEMLERSEIDLKESFIVGPESFDLLWGAFFASGDVEYVKKIIEVLAWPEDEENLNTVMLKGTAKWSLTSIAKRHKLVLDACKNVQQALNPQASESDKAFYDELEEVIQIVEKE